MNPASQYPPRAKAGARHFSVRHALPLLAALLVGGCVSLASSNGAIQATALDAGSTSPVSDESDLPPLAMPERGTPATQGTAATETAPELPVQTSDGASRIQRLFDTAKKHVTTFTGASLDHVGLELVGDEAIDRIVARETRPLVDTQFTDGAFRRSLLDAIMRSQQGSYAALYSGSRTTVMISENMLQRYTDSLPVFEPTVALEPKGISRDELRDQALLALLIHELVHAADDSEHRIHANRTLTFRASFAQSAVFEGHAQWATRQICETHACSEGLAALDRFMFTVTEPADPQAQAVQALSRNVLEFSYVEGERFIRELAARDNGEALIELALKAPPTDPIQILDPGSFPNRARERRNRELLFATSELDHPWRHLPWASVETSPLKGINLRAEPENRISAVDGFTRLITAMVAVQLYDQSHAERPPVEVMLIRTDSEATAALFASIMHENARANGPLQHRERLALRTSTGELANAAVYTAFEPGAAFARAATVESNTPAGLNRTAKPPAVWEPESATLDYASLTATTGRHVVQLAGYASTADLKDYALKFLMQIEASELVDEEQPVAARPSSIRQGAPADS